MKIILQSNDSTYLLLPEFSPFPVEQLVSDWFESSYWKQNNNIIGQSKGRNITWFIAPEIKLSKTPWVLRHYYRGGMVAKLTKDHFLFQGIKNTRCYKELQLLQQMVQLGLPVPKPIAARVIKHGLFYQADLLMEKIIAKDLVAILTSNPLDESCWRDIGRMIAKFHHQGIDHKDLNAHNIMMDKQQFHLIDFDRCLIRVQAPAWQLANLTRLKRSFEKEKQLHQQFYFTSDCWKNLLDGYNQSN